MNIEIVYKGIDKQGILKVYIKKIHFQTSQFSCTQHGRAMVYCTGRRNKCNGGTVPRVRTDDNVPHKYRLRRDGHTA